MTTKAIEVLHRGGHVSEAIPRRTRQDRFYFRMSLFCLAIGVLGFVPTYWIQVPAGTISLPPLVHLHGLIFTAWLVMLAVQSWLAASGRLRRHRDWGLAGIALATLVVAVGLAAASATLKQRIAEGHVDGGQAFLIVSVAAMAGFAVVFSAAVANIRRPDWHKRLVIVATFFLLPAAVARLIGFLLNGMRWGSWAALRPPPPASSPLRAMLLLDLVILVVMLWEWLSDGRVHPAWIWGLGSLLTVHLLLVPLSSTGAWLAFANWFARF